MKPHYSSLFIVALLICTTAFSQEFSDKIDFKNQTIISEDTTKMETAQQPQKRKLLPDNMSLMEKTLWGESGVFRTTGIAPLSLEERKTELQWRRTMLTAHQIGGFVTMGLMGTAVYYGQRLIDGNYQERDNHETFVSATIVAYTITGALSLLSPPPLIRRDESSTISTHKILAWVHIAGMIATPLIGQSIRHSSNANIQRYHQISAYITTATFAAALITVTF